MVPWKTSTTSSVLLMDISIIDRKMHIIIHNSYS